MRRVSLKFSDLEKTNIIYLFYFSVAVDEFSVGFLYELNIKIKPGKNIFVLWVLCIQKSINLSQNIHVCRSFWNSLRQTL